VYKVRRWSVVHARGLETSYTIFEHVLLFLAPILRFIGYERIEKPVAFVERGVKGFLFDCQMCGQCVLSSTGMSCPMNCPKSIRNGPCGGVSPDGYCEVKPDMKCVWVEGYAGSRHMKAGNEIQIVQFAVDHTLEGKSSWLKVVREKSDGGA